MSLASYSKFYYGHLITEANRSIDFKEGSGPELQATLNVGGYTLTGFAAEVKRAMEAAGALTYDVTVDRGTAKLTTSSDSPFSLLVQSGSRLGSSAYPLMGYTGADRTGATSYLSDSTAGFIFAPQFYLQSYISSEDYQDAVDASVNESASGRIEVIRFGLRKFTQMNIQYTTNKIPTGSSMIKANSNGVANLRSFMRYLTEKAPVEFIPDENNPASFESLVLESTESSEQGIGYRLIERYEDQLPGYFDTGILTFRVVE